MTMLYRLLQGQLIIKVVTYATHLVFCQAPSIRVSGVRCQVSGKRNIEAET
jgi:hypothetical protein